MKSPRERRYESNKQRILDTAQKLIAKKGYENVSLREIARKSDYSPAGLYEYYDSKEHILLALRERINSMMIKAVREVSKTGLLGDDIITMGLAYVEFAFFNSEYFNLLNNLPPMRILLEHPDPTTSPFLVFQEAIEALLVEWEVDPLVGFGTREITYSIWTIIHGMATLRVTHLQGIDTDFTESNREVLKIFLGGLRERLEGDK
jgi:AcrR family transcriptional regulator